MNKPLVVYIMGCGRSGTTILDIILGSHSGFLSVGELNNFKEAWLKKKICSCGVSVQECEIGKNIGNLFLNKLDLYRYNIERQRSLGKHFFNLYDPQKLQVYNFYIYTIFNKIKKTSFARVIIDSSKSVGRAFALLKNDMIKVKVIHLIRDPRGVCYSFQKKNIITPEKNVFVFLLYWNIINLLGSLVGLLYGKKYVLRIKYEDIVSNYNKTLDQLAVFLEEDLTDLKKKLKESMPLDKGHISSGNRIRTQKQPVKLKSDFEWLIKLPLYKRVIITILCFPLMLIYGYFNK